MPALAGLKHKHNSAGLSVLVVLISLGKAALSPEFVRLKLAMQTVSLYEPQQVYSADRPNLLLPACTAAARFIRRAAGDAVAVSVDTHDDALSWGIVSSLVRPPESAVTMCTHAGAGPLHVLFRGRPPTAMYVNGQRVAVRLAARPALRRRLKMRAEAKAGKGGDAQHKGQQCKGDGSRGGDIGGGGCGGGNSEAVEKAALERMACSTLRTTAVLHAQMLRALATYTSQLKVGIAISLEVAV